MGAGRETLHDTYLYLRHPRGMAETAIDSRGLGRAVVVTVLSILLTALPFGLVPPPTGPPPTTQPTLVRAAGWAGDHRLFLVLLLMVALLAITAIGYAASVLLARWWGGSRRVGIRRLLVGIGYINCVSLLSAAIPVPPLLLQLGSVRLWEMVNGVVVPLSLLVALWLPVPAWFAMRRGADVSGGRAAAILILASGTAVVVVTACMGGLAL